MGRRFKRTAFDLQNEIFHRHYRDIFALAGHGAMPPE
jgi:hypothetical protein